MDAERPRETVDEMSRRVCAQLRGSELTKGLTTEAAERSVEYLTRLLASAPPLSTEQRRRIADTVLADAERHHDHPGVTR